MKKLNYSYGNFIAGNINDIYFYTQSKADGTFTAVDETHNKWGHSQNYLRINAITDGKENTVYDFAGGIRGKESYNFLIELECEELIEKIAFTCADWEQIYPTRLNMYVGNSIEEIFSLDTAPVKEFTQKAADGKYIAELDGIRSQLVRIEVLDNGCDYYGDMLMIAVKDIGIYGDLNAPQATFGKELVRSLKRARNRPVTVMQPYLYKDTDGWTNEHWQSAKQYEKCEVDLGEGFTCVDISSGRMINIGSEREPALISAQQDLPSLNSYEDLYFYLRLDGSGECGSGRLKLQFVTGDHSSALICITAEPDKWVKINLRDFVNTKTFLKGEYNRMLRRVAVSAADGKINTKITVGSMLGISKVDWSKYGVDIKKAVNYTKEEWDAIGINIKKIIGEDYEF